MKVEDVKVGNTVKIDIEEAMKVHDCDSFESFVALFFGENENVLQWMKEENAFEVLSLEIGGVLDSGEYWRFVKIVPYTNDIAQKEDFEYEMEDEDGVIMTTSEFLIENFLLTTEE